MEQDVELFDLLSVHVKKFKKWIVINFTPEQIAQGQIDDAGYPRWDEIENLLMKIFKEIKFDNVNESNIDIIIYLIARNWDLGTILSWLTDGHEFSQLGMTEEQFLVIAKRGANSSEFDARYQIASMLSRVSSINKEIAIELALKYYEDEYEFVRRKALTSLFKLDYLNIHELIIKSWLNDEEYERMLCLYLLREMKSKKYNDFLVESLSDERVALKEYAESMKNGVDTWSIK
jgi:hypothetical protein